MGTRVDRVNVVMDFFVELEGVRSSTFTFVPDMSNPADVLLVNALSAKNDAILLAAAKAAGPADLGIG